MKSIDKRKSVFNIIIIPVLIILMAITGGLLAVFFPTDSGQELSNQTSTDNTPDVGVMADGETTTFNYTGGVQSFTVPKDGYYFVQLWGASGGGNTPNTNVGSMAGAGGYTEGAILLTQNTVLYLHVGGQGKNVANTLSAGGYNGGGGGGGGGGDYGGSGGGATDVRLATGTWNNADALRSRIMVAGGGGGSDDLAGNTFNSNNDGRGGAGGGINGENGRLDGALSAAIPGGRQTNTAAEGQASFGNGGNAVASRSDTGGGGGGYYGGAGSHNGNAGGGGGSSYISGLAGCNSITSATNGAHTGSPTHYSGKVFKEAVTIAGNASMPNPAGGTMVGRGGNGYARITQRNNLPIEGEAGNREKETTRSGEEIEYIVKNGHARSIGKDKDEEDELGYYLKSEESLIASKSLIRVRATGGAWSNVIGKTGTIRVGSKDIYA